MRLVKRILQNQRGQTLPAVLILLMFGTLLVVPSLGLVSTNLNTVRMVEEKDSEIYAADSGIEYGLHRVKNGVYPVDEYITVNDVSVRVQAQLEETGVGFLADLLGLPPGQVYHAAHPKAVDWTVAYSFPEPGQMLITITYNGTQTPKIEGIGGWLPGSFDYVPGSAQGITDSYPSFEFLTEPYKGGTAFTWRWPNANKPRFDGPGTITERFQFSPPETPETPVAWVEIQPNSGFLSLDGSADLFRVSADAGQTRVESYAIKVGSGVFILTWDQTQ